MLQTFIVLVIIIAIGAYIASVYNRLVALINQADNAFAQIDIQLKRRYDLIPNLVEIAKKYMAHEEGTLLKVTQARNAAKSALDAINQNGLDSARLAQLSGAENALAEALKGLNITLEAYPDLKANQNMMQLSEEVASTENKIAFSRQAYNDSAMGFNIYKQSFPQNFIAGFFARFKRDLGMLEFEENRATLNAAPKITF